MKCALVTLCILCSSCSNLKRQKILGAVIGSVVLGSVGASIGQEISPNKDSERFNLTLGGLGGGAIGLYLGAEAGKYFWQEYPDHKTLGTSLYHNHLNSQEKRIQVLRPKSIKRIKLEKNIPSFLKGKVKETNVLIYQLDSYEEETPDGRKVIHEPHKAYEYILE